DSSAMATCLRLRSTVECTATVRMPRAWHARRMRRAISPRLAMTTLSSMGFGIRDSGFASDVFLADVSWRRIQRAQQGVQLGVGAIDRFAHRRGLRGESESFGDLELGIEFRQRAAGDRKEANVFGSGSPCGALGDVGGDADGCATHLRRQAEALRIRKVAGMPINVFDKRHRVAPDLQTLVG